MTIKILLALVGGILAGNYIDPDIIEALISSTDYLLWMLLFLAGLSIGYTGDIKGHARGIGLDVIFVPIFTIIGTLFGSYVASLILRMDKLDLLAIGSGFGWYSLSAVMIARHNSVIGAIGFMTNIFREVLSIIFIPFIAKNIGYLEAVSAGGATTADTTMPPISRYTDSKTIIVAFFNGIILSFAVPFFVEFFLALKYGV